MTSGRSGVGGPASWRLRLTMSQRTLRARDLVEGLLGGVGVGGGVEEQDGELRNSASGEVEGRVAGDEEDGVVGGNFGVGGADEFFKGGEPGAGGGEAAQRREGGAGDGAVELDVAEALVAGGVESAAEKEGCGDDDGEWTGDARNLSEKRGDEKHEERPECVSGPPELLGEECAVDRCEKDERKKAVEDKAVLENSRTEIGEGESCGEDEEMRPEREKLTGAVGGTGVAGEDDDSPEKGRGEKEEGDGRSGLTPTRFAENAEWMGQPEFYFPPIAMRLRWMGHSIVAAEQDEGNEGCGDGPEKRGLAVDGEKDAEAGETALGGEGDGSGDVVAQTDSGVDNEQCGGERGGCAGEEPELRSGAGASQAAGDGDRCDGGEDGEEEGQADVLLEEERKDAEAVPAKALRTADSLAR